MREHFLPAGKPGHGSGWVFGKDEGFAPEFLIHSLLGDSAGGER